MNITIDTPSRRANLTAPAASCETRSPRCAGSPHVTYACERFSHGTRGVDYGRAMKRALPLAIVAGLAVGATALAQGTGDPYDSPEPAVTAGQLLKLPDSAPGCGSVRNATVRITPPTGAILGSVRILGRRPAGRAPDGRPARRQRDGPDPAVRCPPVRLGRDARRPATALHAASTPTARARPTRATAPAPAWAAAARARRRGALGLGARRRRGVRPLGQRHVRRARDRQRRDDEASGRRERAAVLGRLVLVRLVEVEQLEHRGAHGRAVLVVADGAREPCQRERLLRVCAGEGAAHRGHEVRDHALEVRVQRCDAVRRRAGVGARLAVQQPRHLLARDRTHGVRTRVRPGARSAARRRPTSRAARRASRSPTAPAPAGRGRTAPSGRPGSTTRCR